MLNIEVCKNILQQNGKNYTDEKVKQIRDLLYKLGNLDYQLFTSNKQKNGKCNNIHKGFNGGAS
jgi:hypothetical protein